MDRCQIARELNNYGFPREELPDCKLEKYGYFFNNCFEILKKYDSLLRDDLPFRSWNLDIRYLKSGKPTKVNLFGCNYEQDK